MKKYFANVNRKAVMTTILVCAFVLTTTVAYAAMTLSTDTISGSGALNLSPTGQPVTVNGDLTVGNYINFGILDSAFDSNLRDWTYAYNNIRQINTDPTDGHANLSVEVQSTSGAEAIWGVAYVTGDNNEADGVTADAVITGNGSSAFAIQPRAYSYGGDNQELRGGDFQAGTGGGTNTTIHPIYIRTPFTFNGGTMKDVTGLYIENFSGLTASGVKQAINYADKFVVDSTGAVTATSVKITPITVSALPTCNSGAKGTQSYVTDSNTSTWGATIAGGGANNVGASCNGTNWTVFSK